MTQPQNNSIRIIGPRASGKTTYLASLLFCPHLQEIKLKIPGFTLDYAEDSETESIARLAENILKKGAKLAPTPDIDVANIPIYSLRIKIPSSSKIAGANIDLSVRDFAGEIFQDIALEHKANHVQPYINDLFNVPSWMVMLTDWQPEQDTKLYKRVFEKLCKEISEREQINPEIKNLRIAVVMSKCERGELWPGRWEPDEDLFKVRLPKTYEFLSRKFPAQTNRLKFFACSAFGILGDSPENYNPRPNRYVPDDGSSAEYSAYLRVPSQWKPFGLISPIYWLSTGKTLYDPYI